MLTFVPSDIVTAIFSLKYQILRISTITILPRIFQVAENCEAYFGIFVLIQAWLSLSLYLCMSYLKIMQCNLLELSIKDSFIASCPGRVLFHNRFLENFAVLEQLLHIGAFTGLR